MPPSTASRDSLNEYEMGVLSPLERAFVNRFQGGVPLVERPYRMMGEALGVSEGELLDLIRGLLELGLLTRFGPSYDASRIEGELTLAAMAVHETRFDAVADQVNALPAVAHNYRRDHTLNMWFVISSLERGGVAACIREIEAMTGLKIHDFPKQREFYLGLWLHLDEDGRVETIPAPSTPGIPVDGRGEPGEDLCLGIIRATQEGLPLVEAPFDRIGRTMGLTPQVVMEAMGSMLAKGAIRRIGAMPNHYRLGLRGNGMTVWDVPDERVEEAGQAMGALDFVSHCYERVRHPGIWPYNLFAMVHGRDQGEVMAKADRIAVMLGGLCRGRDTLSSTAILKKSGLRI